MVKITGPLFSEAVTGTIGKVITFGFNQAGAWARSVFKKKDAATPAQQAQRAIFLAGMNEWKKANKLLVRAWWLETRGSCKIPRDGFMTAWLRAKGVQWDNYPWVPPTKIEPTIRICKRNASNQGGWILIRFKTCLVSQFPYYLPSGGKATTKKTYTELQLNEVGTGESMEAGFDLYEADEPDMLDPSCQYVKSYEGGKYQYAISGYTKRFAGIVCGDRHGRTLYYSKDQYGNQTNIVWLYNWDGFFW